MGLAIQRKLSAYYELQKSMYTQLFKQYFKQDTESQPQHVLGIFDGKRITGPGVFTRIWLDMDLYRSFMARKK